MTHRVAAAFTIKRFLRPESDVENNIIYFEYLLGKSSPPRWPFPPAHFWIYYCCYYIQATTTMSLRLDRRRPVSDFRLTEPSQSTRLRWGVVVCVCVGGGGGSGISTYLYCTLRWRVRRAKDLYMLYDCAGRRFRSRRVELVFFSFLFAFFFLSRRRLPLAVII